MTALIITGWVFIGWLGIALLACIAYMDEGEISVTYRGLFACFVVALLGPLLLMGCLIALAAWFFEENGHKVLFTIKRNK